MAAVLVYTWKIKALLIINDPCLPHLLCLCEYIAQKEPLVLVLQFVLLHNVVPYFIKYPIDNPSTMKQLL